MRVKVGLLDTLGTRHLRYWGAFLQELGVELLRPQLPMPESYALGRQSLPGEPPQVQLALGRLLELDRADLVVAPKLPGLAGDPWSEAFGEVLSRRISSLPALVLVPPDGPEVASAATELGQRLIHNPGKVRLALERVKPLQRSGRAAMPALSAPARRTVAVIGPEALLADAYLSAPLRARLEDLGLHAVYSTDLPRDQLERYAARSGAASEAERELAGALAWLGGKADVRGALLAVPARDGPARALGARLLAGAQKSGARKPALLLELAPEIEGWPELPGFVDRVTLGALARAGATTEENP